MDFNEKAKIRIEHWLSHSESHISEYQEFVQQLEKEGKQDCADHIRQMISHTEKGNEYLRMSIKAL